MPDPFFQSDRKRKRPARAGQSSSGRGGGSRAAPARRARADSVSSASSAGSSGAGGLEARRRAEAAALGDDEFDEAAETAAEKRVRMARGYLREVQETLAREAEDAGDVDAAVLDREIIASRLKQDVDEAEGKIHLALAQHVSSVRPAFVPLPHSPTALALTPTVAYVSTKRGSVVPVALAGLSRGRAFGPARGPAAADRPAGHRGALLAVAASEDGKWVVSGGADRVVGVWDVAGAEPVWRAGITGHKDAITSLALPPLSNPSAHVLSASLSRHLHLHSLATLSTLDTFFGHQDAVASVSALKPAAAVTAGARDRTARWWKLEEEVQLVLRGGGRTRAPAPQVPQAAPADGEAEGAAAAAKRPAPAAAQEYYEGSLDVVCALDDSHFLSGGDSGSICLWSTGKKKPVFTFALAHGVDPSAHNPFPSPPPSPNAAAASASASAAAADAAPALADPAPAPQPRWITSLAHLRTSNLFASGSYDGRVRLWALDAGLRSFAPVAELPARGFVNGLALAVVPRPNLAPALRGQAGGAGQAEQAEQAELAELAELDGAAEARRAAGMGSRAPREIILAAAVAQEPRLGRWLRLKEKNGLLVARVELDAEGAAML